MGDGGNDEVRPRRPDPGEDENPYPCRGLAHTLPDRGAKCPACPVRTECFSESSLLLAIATHNMVAQLGEMVMAIGTQTKAIKVDKRTPGGIVVPGGRTH